MSTNHFRFSLFFYALSIAKSNFYIYNRCIPIRDKGGCNMTDYTIKKETFSQRLEALMQENNETIYTLAEVLELSPATISRYRSGEFVPKKTTIKILSQYFHINPVWLMGYNVEKKLETVNLQLTQEEIDFIDKYRKLTDRQKIKLEGIMENYISENLERKKREACSEKCNIS